ncbi:N-alpha-acetyltransferase 40 [Tritrichomonas musculus]|uniref:N-alpha-acetyltransferase 40 n=1 Tax=Tritrichomonas musculus TaxID=1915356 RepID=A0ABR2KZ04_9EUKA
MTKAQLRKQKIKEETEMYNAKKKLISDAEAIEDLLADIPMFKNFEKNGLKCTVKSYNSCPEEFKEWVYELTARHMQQYYENSWGWSEKNKKSELFEEHTRYLIATQVETNRPIGFIHIRFEMEYKETTCYVYELQIEDEFQRRGLGRFLMQAAEFIALKRKMESVMLTVFVDNVGSRAFYKKMNYKLHPSTPVIADRENSAEYSHEILFKPLVKKT